MFALLLSNESQLLGYIHLETRNLTVVAAFLCCHCDA